jgi:peptidoglycan/xylan/chitin deacetylase (PgdA/CDA1 family)
LPKDPAISRVDRLILASVSNWGGYGLVAALSRLVGRDLLPTVEQDRQLIRQMVDAGAVDGTSGENKYYVDNFTLDQNGKVLERLHQMATAITGDACSLQEPQGNKDGDSSRC